MLTSRGLEIVAGLGSNGILDNPSILMANIKRCFSLYDCGRGSLQVSVVGMKYGLHRPMSVARVRILSMHQMVPASTSMLSTS